MTTKPKTKNTKRSKNRDYDYQNDDENDNDAAGMPTPVVDYVHNDGDNGDNNNNNNNNSNSATGQQIQPLQAQQSLGNNAVYCPGLFASLVRARMKTWCAELQLDLARRRAFEATDGRSCTRTRARFSSFSAKMIACPGPVAGTADTCREECQFGHSRVIALFCAHAYNCTDDACSRSHDLYWNLQTPPQELCCPWEARSSEASCRYLVRGLFCPYFHAVSQPQWLRRVRFFNPNRVSMWALMQTDRQLRLAMRTIALAHKTQVERDWWPFERVAYDPNSSEDDRREEMCCTFRAKMRRTMMTAEARASAEANQKAIVGTVLQEWCSKKRKEQKLNMNGGK